MAANYLMGAKTPGWKEKDVKSITFVVTEDCNLICKYCYITGKNTKNKMDFAIAKKAVDFILDHPEDFPENSVIFEFIGGEPFLEVELIDQISDYIKTELYRRNHKWFNNYRFSMATNGLLYGTPAVQRYIQKNLSNLSIGISVDGTKIKHDLQRIKPDGSGSYDDVVKNIPLWLSQFPNSSTKATFSSEDLPFLKDSIINLYNLGIKNIPANVVFEDCWKEGDDQVFEDQLRELADYIIDNRLWQEFSCTLFLDLIGYPVTEEGRKSNWCGAGRMLAIDYQGNFYPCVRFVGYSLNKRQGYVIGNVEQGYDHDKLRPFFALNLEKQSTQECLDCQVATGCGWCQGFNFDEAEIDTIYQRATYICKMHKARVRANDYYWGRLREVAGIEREQQKRRKDFLYFLLSDRSVRHCVYNLKSPVASKTGQNEVKMSLEMLQQGLEFARQNFYTPVLILPKEGLTAEERALLRGIDTIEVHAPETPVGGETNILIYDNQVDILPDSDICNLIIKPANIPQLSTLVKKIFSKLGRINLVLEEIELLTDADLEIYEQELEKIAAYILTEYLVNNPKDFNVLTDLSHLHKMENCNAGVDSFTLAPDGSFYICPAFYYDQSPAVGSLQDGITFHYQEYLKLEKSPVCTICDVYHCRRCVYLNRKQTREYLIPGRTQCVLSHIEQKLAKKLIANLQQKGLMPGPESEEIDAENNRFDPLEKIWRR